MDIEDFQQMISKKYEQRDRQRGLPATFMWFIEEVGELATALAGEDMANKQDEFADVLAWLLIACAFFKPVKTGVFSRLRYRQCPDKPPLEHLFSLLADSRPRFHRVSAALPPYPPLSRHGKNTTPAPLLFPKETQQE
ncbi:MAG: MazG nucleotide pyrophosphohydrolase domain-containing protein [Planctomycetota bacterium]|jgi:hypothetical protein